jgi:hypothetical protein
MPWKIKRDKKNCPEGYVVVKEGTEEILGCHDTRESAARQLRALYASERK